MSSESYPRPFGRYVLTAPLGEDALGRVYRALRASGEPGFFRLRILESPELSRDALLDTIEENGETHSFLKNIAIARGVDMDAVEGVPYVAWLEENGRTLDALLEACRRTATEIPVEHSLLICEKIAAALDHAYNTMIDGDRTLHGLVWPGFVSISDEGEIRVAGFGLAPGVLPALHRTRVASTVTPYIAPEERATETVARNSDVYSVGVILLELATGAPPSADALASLRDTAKASALPPELLHVLRTALSPGEGRYASAGELRRELGRLLFSGSYSPSTFNLAYFLNDLFRDEIEREVRSRAREIAFVRAPSGPPRLERRGSDRPAGPQPPSAPDAGAPGGPPASASVPEFQPEPTPRPRRALFVAGGVLVAMAIGGGVFFATRQSPAPVVAAAAPTALPRPVAPPTALPELVPTPAQPTAEMNEAQFQEEVSRRLALEVQKLEADIRARTPTPVPTVRLEVPAVIEPLPLPTSPPTATIPSPVPSPTRAIVREGSLVALDQVDLQPRILKIVKPPYPPLALQARIGGVVLLRVLVSEKGEPARIEVLREARGGLTQAAVEAVRQWTFAPATKDGVAVQTWMTVPVPFAP
jgi:protein TonB